MMTHKLVMTSKDMDKDVIWLYHTRYASFKAPHDRVSIYTQDIEHQNNNNV